MDRQWPETKGKERRTRPKGKQWFGQNKVVVANKVADSLSRAPPMASGAWQGKFQAESFCLGDGSGFKAVRGASLDTPLQRGHIRFVAERDVPSGKGGFRKASTHPTRRHTSASWRTRPACTFTPQLLFVHAGRVHHDGGQQTGGESLFATPLRASGVLTRERSDDSISIEHAAARTESKASWHSLNLCCPRAAERPKRLPTPLLRCNMNVKRLRPVPTNRRN